MTSGADRPDAEEVGPWQVTIPDDRLPELRDARWFHTLLTLARSVNFLRFSLLASERVSFDEGSYAERQHINSFFLMCSILWEGHQVLQTLGEFFRSCDAYPNKIQPLLSDKQYERVRNELIKPLRNTSAFHFDRDVMASALKQMNLPEFRLITGINARMGNIYYPLADEAVIADVLGSHSQSEEELIEKARDWMELVAEVALRYVKAADALIVEVFRKWEGGEFPDENGA